MFAVATLADFLVGMASPSPAPASLSLPECAAAWQFSVSQLCCRERGDRHAVLPALSWLPAFSCSSHRQPSHPITRGKR